MDRVYGLDIGSSFIKAAATNGEYRPGPAGTVAAQKTTTS